MFTHTLDEVSVFLEKYIPQKTTIVVGVSWWPDSMFLARSLQEYYDSKWREQKHIAIAHYNHWQRQVSHKEHLFLKKHFKNNTFYWNTEIPQKWLNETKLRIHRHKFFADVMEEAASEYLFLWHNITDRIETSIMNMVRWASKDGLLWIKPIQKKKNYSIYRPLLTIEKQTITDMCDTLNIPYFIDTTNSKPITSRNIIRNTIVPNVMSLHSGWKKNWSKSWTTLYSFLEWWIVNDAENRTNFVRKSHVPHSFWQAKHWFSSHINNISDAMIMGLFKDSYYATTKTLLTIKNFIQHAEWYIFVGWWYIFKVWEIIHCIDGKHKFWEEKHSYNQKITQYWNRDINWYTYDILKQRAWYTLRYPQPWDTYKKKRLLKVLLNMKIPVFMRNITPLIVHKKTIISILSANDNFVNI